MSVRLRVLGASGGIGGARRTICLQLGENALIDAGTGAGTLELDEIIGLEHVFLTHSHLDHIALLPLLADAAVNFRATGLTVHALAETWQTLRQSVFNGLVWPDYTCLPSADAPYIRYAPIEPGKTVALGELQLLPLPAAHSVAATAYAVIGQQASLAYSADSTWCPAFWHALGSIPRLRYVLVECTFRDEQQAAASRSGHMTPRMLKTALATVPADVEVSVLHMEPGMEGRTMMQLSRQGLVLKQVREGDEYLL